MKIGLVGLPKSGKTTLFNALTKSHAEVSAYSGGKAEPNRASVAVEDERLTRISDIVKPKKTIYVRLDLMDFAGFTSHETESPDFSPELLQLIRLNDALAVVLRNFPRDLEDDPSPLERLSMIESEFLLADHIIVENRLERIEKARRTGQFTPLLESEQKLLKRIEAFLDAGQPLRELELEESEKKAVNGFKFLTLKPVMVVLNSSEQNFGQNAATLAELNNRYPTIECAGDFEMELSQLDDEDEIEAFLADMGIAESARLRLTKTAFDMLGYISFFTIGKDEVRAWNIVRGETALDAAGSVHTDMARGFIRAECYSFEDFIECGGEEKAVKEAGKFRLEGRDYVVKDGDMLCFRFNV
jgi:GTP-binding protein YchF